MFKSIRQRFLTISAATLFCALSFVALSSTTAFASTTQTASHTTTKVQSVNPPNPGQPDQNLGQPNPKPGQPNPKPGQPNPKPGQPNPMPGRPNPMPGQPDHRLGQPDHKPVHHDNKPVHHDNNYACPANLHPGDSGQNVQTLQRFLNNHGFSIDVTGRFDNQTKQAVEQFQSQHHWGTDGNVGTAFWQALGKC